MGKRITQNVCYEWNSPQQSLVNRVKFNYGKGQTASLPGVQVEQMKAEEDKTRQVGYDRHEAVELVLHMTSNWKPLWHSQQCTWHI